MGSNLEFYDYVPIKITSVKYVSEIMYVIVNIRPSEVIVSQILNNDVLYSSNS